MKTVISTTQTTTSINAQNLQTSISQQEHLATVVGVVGPQGPQGDQGPQGEPGQLTYPEDKLRSLILIDPRQIARWDIFDRADSPTLGTSTSGHIWTSQGFQVKDNIAIGNNTPPSLAVLDNPFTGLAREHVARMRVLQGSAQEGYLIMFWNVVDDVSNYVRMGLRQNSLVIEKVVDGIMTILSAQSAPSFHDSQWTSTQWVTMRGYIKTHNNFTELYCTVDGLGFGAVYRISNDSDWVGLWEGNDANGFSIRSATTCCISSFYVLNNDASLEWAS